MIPSASDVHVYHEATNLLPPDLIAVTNNMVPQPVPDVNMPACSYMVTNHKKPVKFDPQSLYYDMSGEKIMLIFNHSTYESGGFYGNDPPKDRAGTDRDVAALYQQFTGLGYNVRPYHNKRHQEIKNLVTEVCAQDHSATSCLAVVIMTHGGKGRLLYAYDRPYYLSEILNIFETGHYTLVNKPKLFFIQAADVEFCTRKIIDNDLSSTQISSNFNTDAKVLEHGKMGPNEACRGPLVDAGRFTYHDNVDKKLIHVPTHVDFFIARSTVENYRAWKTDRGSWYIQELCDIVRMYHKELDILQLLTLVTRRVAYKYKTFTLEPELHDKKETPETTYTLTKLLKL